MNNPLQGSLTIGKNLAELTQKVLERADDFYEAIRHGDEFKHIPVGKMPGEMDGRIRVRALIAAVIEHVQSESVRPPRAKRDTLVGVPVCP